MACFLVPLAEAIVVTSARKVKERKVKKALKADGKDITVSAVNEKAPFLRKVKWLTNLLWGGSALLAFEHLWHGEITPWFPFLTAAASPEEAAEMFKEMATAGVGMAVAVTAVWGIILLVSYLREKNARKETEKL